MKVLVTAAIVVGLGIAGLAQAEWTPYQQKDEMRGTTTNTYALRETAIGNESISMALTVIEKQGKAEGVVFSVAGDKIACMEKYCIAEIRFDDGGVQKTSIVVAEDRSLASPADSSAFVGSLALSKILYIEIPLKGAGSSQFKFVTDGAKFERVFSPEFAFAGMQLGGQVSGLPDGFSPDQKNPALNCGVAEGLSGAIPGVKLSKARVCLFQGRFYSASITAANKAEFDRVAAFVSKAYGKPDSDRTYPKWPKPTDKMVQHNTSDVTFWPDAKTKGGGNFFIVDNAISPLVPIIKN